jgi:murein DD-endopeptidase MepM/ murein hydrolase activator NlpD
LSASAPHDLDTTSGVRAVRAARRPPRRRAVALLVLSFAILAPAMPARATTLGAAEHRVRELNRRIHDRQLAIRSYHRQLARLGARADRIRRPPTPAPWIRARQANVETRSSDLRKRRRARLRKVGRQRAAVQRRLAASQRAIQALARSKEQTVDLIWRIRPIGLCPVRGPHDVNDDFGAPRWVDGKYHTHMGNDILAPYGTPIVAPFDGRAAAAPNALGGMAVKVFGASGYVYNAHLSRYGRLGEVTAGTVIGYVGNSGDARGGPAHDHFEWHPGGGGAVDPNPLLTQVC